MTNNLQLATFAGGCFWCMVKPFDQWEGIHSVVSGYMGGHIENPSYEDVKTGNSGHVEVVQIKFDPSIISYKELLDIYWQQIDPTDAGGQFHDRGDSYQTVIFYHNEDQKLAAEQSKTALEESGKFTLPIVTKIKQADTFYPAEDYHQDYYKKNAKEYLADRNQSGRDEFINKYWN